MSLCAQSSQRMTWPPRVAVRQFSIADITFNCSRLTRPTLALRHVGPCSRKTSATSSAGRGTGAADQAGGLRRRLAWFLAVVRFVGLAGVLRFVCLGGLDCRQGKASSAGLSTLALSVRSPGLGIRYSSGLVIKRRADSAPALLLRCHALAERLLQKYAHQAVLQRKSGVAYRDHNQQHLRFFHQQRA